MLQKVFIKGQDIEIIIEEKIDNRISLNWDKKLEVNKNIYDVFILNLKYLTTIKP